MTIFDIKMIAKQFKQIIAGLSLIGISVTALVAQNFVVDEDLQAALDQGDTVDMFIIMEEEAMFLEWQSTMSKEEKGAYVFEQLSSLAQSSQQEVVSILEEKEYTYRPYHIFNGIFLEADSSILSELADIQNIREILPNYAIRSQSTETRKVKRKKRKRQELPWGLEAIRANLVWEMGVTGKGAVVGGEDTGYDWDHEALLDKYRGFVNGEIDHSYNWHDGVHEPHPLNAPNTESPCGYSSVEPCDDNGHGTHTMGTMVGATEAETYGVAPDAKWIGARNMDRGWGSIASYVECLEWFLAPTDLEDLNPRPELAPDVINNSWGCPSSEGCKNTNSYLIETAIQNLKRAGVFVAVSAGNSGRNGCGTVSTPPSTSPSSFAVGATRQDGLIADFSSRGSYLVQGDSIVAIKPDVSAPGQSVLSSFPNNTYTLSSGTSMAAPHVAGTVALMVSANPSLRGHVVEMERIIEETATGVRDSSCSDAFEVPNPVYGYGIIDAYEAVMAAMEFENETVSVAPSITESNDEWLIYPNPASYEITIMKSDQAPEEFAIVNVSGQVLHRFVAWGRRHLLSLNGYPAGVYFLQSLKNGRNQKIIVEGY